MEKTPQSKSLNTDADKVTDPEIPRSRDHFPIVGLGASAGGLRALKVFFENMPAENGMAFVVILHLSPEHESHAAEILQRSTQMPVEQVNETVKVELNHVYVIPPTKNLAMIDGEIRLTELEKKIHGQPAAIDLFFRTLADAHETSVACIVLSGNGADGSNGIKRVKEGGGFAMVQEPGDAEYDSMPRNAINTGMVDFVLPVAEMPQKLIELWQNFKRIQLPPETAPVLEKGQQAEVALQEILSLVKMRTSHDFTHYKRATILRRMERRMQVNAQQDLPAYLAFLQENIAETRALLKDLLIGVTNFFRDRPAFEALEREVIPQLFEGKQAEDLIRVWVAGCATGEEAYSLAILLSDHASRITNAPKIQIFATDIDEDSIAEAREGKYAESIAIDVPPNFLRQFFTHEPGGYRVNKKIRECVLFALHNLIKDPPFSKLDLITCRNLLIYLSRNVQEQIFQLFNFTLRPGGFIFLGGSESLENLRGVFATVDKKNRIYRSNTVTSATRNMPVLPLQIPSARIRPKKNYDTTAERNRIAFGQLHQQVLEQYAPPSVIVNQDYEIVHLSEHAGRFLQLGGGEPTLNLLKVVLPELRLELRTTLFQALQTGKSVEAPRLRLTRDNHTTYLTMIARPTSDPETAARFILVTFAEVEETLGFEGKELPRGDSAEPVMQHLEEELARTKEQLQTMIEQHETSVEELKASNEELQSINEEMRSTTEELETSKEELQSVNEELRTVNDELKLKVEEVSHRNDDLRNLISSMDIGILFLNRELCIRRYTPRMTELFNLIPTDEGRQITDITSRLDYPDLLADATKVLAQLVKIEREVRSEEGHYYLVHLVPFRTMKEQIDGVVLTFVDITVRKSEERLRSIIGQATAGVTEVNLNNRFIFVNDAFCEMTGYTRAELLQMSNPQITHPDDVKRYDKQFEQSIATGKSNVLEKRLIRKNGSEIFVSDSMSIILDAAGKPHSVVNVFVDISESKLAGEKLLAAHDQLEIRVAERTAELDKTNHSLRAEIGESKLAKKTRQNLLRRLSVAEENERRRISRELHDESAQHLAALTLGLKILESGKDPTPRKTLKQLQKIARRVGEEIHRLALDLRPTSLDDLGLVGALSGYAENWSRRTKIKIDFQSHGFGKERLPTPLETTVYRIAQEALTNVLKHADAKKVSIILAQKTNLVSMIVEDDGAGFDPNIIKKKPGKRLGILSMKERAALVDGELNIESRPRKGTTIFVRLPLPQKTKKSA